MKHYFFDLQLFADDPTPAPTETKPEPTPEEAKQEPKPEPVKKYTDEDVDRIIDQKFKKWQEKQQKAVDEAKKLAEMSAQQKAEYERDQFKKELEEYKRKDSLSEMTKTARKMLSEEGISVPDELLSMMVNTDAEQTKAAIDSFTKAFNDAVESAVKERLKGEPPKRGTGSGAKSMTKEQIMAIKDTELRQKAMLEHRELFNI